MLAAMALTMPAFAAGSNRPWEQPLQQILQSIEGPAAKIIAVIIIITTGLTLAFDDISAGFPSAGADRLRPLDRRRRVYGGQAAGLTLAGQEPPPVIGFRVLTHRLPGTRLQPR